MTCSKPHNGQKYVLLLPINQIYLDYCHRQNKKQNKKKQARTHLFAFLSLGLSNTINRLFIAAYALTLATNSSQVVIQAHCMSVMSGLARHLQHRGTPTRLLLKTFPRLEVFTSATSSRSLPPPPTSPLSLRIRPTIHPCRQERKGEISALWHLAHIQNLHDKRAPNLNWKLPRGCKCVRLF